MGKLRLLTGTLGVVLFLAFSSSVRADGMHADMLMEKLLFAENHSLAVFDDNQRAETGYLYQGHFENNNGKHLGFSIAAFNRNPRLGIVKPESPSVTQNPEPTAMVLLGTGLAAVAAFARRKKRRQS